MYLAIIKLYNRFFSHKYRDDPESRNSLRLKSIYTIFFFFRQKDIIPTANKRFLQRTIASTLPRRTENLQKKKRKNTKSPTNHSKCGEVSEKPKPNEKTIDSKTTFKTKKVDKKRKLSAHSYVLNKKRKE